MRYFRVETRDGVDTLVELTPDLPATLQVLEEPPGQPAFDEETGEWVAGTPARYRERPLVFGDIYPGEGVPEAAGLAVGMIRKGKGWVMPPPPPQPQPDPVMVEATVRAEFTRRILAVATLEQQTSLARYGLRLALKLRRPGATLTAEEEADVAIMDALDLWEGDMVSVRDRLIAAGDAAAASRDETWPAPPEGAAALAAAC